MTPPTFTCYGDKAGQCGLRHLSQSEATQHCRDDGRDRLPCPIAADGTVTTERGVVVFAPRRARVAS